MKMQQDQVKPQRRYRNGKLVSAAAVSMLGGASMAHAVTLAPAAPHNINAVLTPFGPPSGSGPTNVVAGSSFDIQIVGFNSSNGEVAITNDVTPTFGTTQNFTGDTIDGSTLTVSSSESVSGGVTTDLITISVPTDFDPSGDAFSTPAVEMFAAFGDYVGPNLLQFAAPINAASLNGSGVLLYSGGSVALTPTLSLSDDNAALSGNEGVNAGGADLEGFGINSFSFTLTYTVPVPEPATAGIFVSLAGAGLLRRRRR
jgi:hypothetical protein